MDDGTRATPPGTGRAARLLLMSDTHLPRRAKQLPGELLRAVEQADLVVHAGDWIDEATVDLLNHRARRLVGVYGNNDGPELQARCRRWPGSRRAACGSASSTRQGRCLVKALADRWGVSDDGATVHCSLDLPDAVSA